MAAKKPIVPNPSKSAKRPPVTTKPDFRRPRRTVTPVEPLPHGVYVPTAEEIASSRGRDGLEINLPVVYPTTPAHPIAAGVDIDHTKFADTAREGFSQRLTFEQTSAPIDFTSLSRAEERYDPWGVNRPVGGNADPTVGRPRQG